MIDTTGTGEPKEIATTLLQLGATSYGGPAIMGVMQAELQQRRKWVSKERFLEGLAVANMVPGATATQLGIFLAYARGGWWGGLLGGIVFVLPAFVIMLALTIAYATLGVTPLARSALYGLGPVVIGLFTIALYRLAKTAVSTVAEAIIGIAAAAALATARLGIVAILVLAGCAGLFIFHRGLSGLRVRWIAGCSSWQRSASPSGCRRSLLLQRPQGSRLTRAISFMSPSSSSKSARSPSAAA